jgi:WD40 repeat protein
VHERVIRDRSPLTAGAFSPSGKLLAVAGDDGVLRVVEVDTGFERTLFGHGHAVRYVTFSADETYLASADEYGEIRVWHTPVPSGDGRRLLTASMDGTVRVWSLPGGTLERVLDGHEGGATYVAASADGKYAATTDTANTVRVWDLNALSSEPRVLSGTPGNVQFLIFSPDSRRLGSPANNVLRIFDCNGSIETRP